MALEPSGSVLDTQGCAGSKLEPHLGKADEAPRARVRDPAKRRGPADRRRPQPGARRARVGRPGHRDGNASDARGTGTQVATDPDRCAPSLRHAAAAHPTLAQDMHTSLNMNNRNSQYNNKWLHAHRYAGRSLALSVVSHMHTAAFTNLSSTFHAASMLDSRRRRTPTPDITACRSTQTDETEDVQGDLSCRPSKRTKRPNNVQ